MQTQTATGCVPVMIYDGDCGFCRRWIRRWAQATGPRIEYLASRDAAGRFPGIGTQQLDQAVHLVEPDGHVTSGAHAVFRALRLGADRRGFLWLYERAPGFAVVAEVLYRFVARHRRPMSALTWFFWGKDVGLPSYLLTRWIFVRGLAVVYLIAFASLGVQIPGLVGSDGILPAGEFLDRARERFGDDAYRRLPTLAWLRCDDEVLQWSCRVGAGFAGLVILRVAPAVFLLALWGLYFSLYQIGQTFLGFQWDILLLETGVLGMLWVSWKPWPRLRTDSVPSPLVRWLIVLLLFRLMFSSGIVKLLDDNLNQPTWHELTALTYHYQTQCIPNAVAWYAHQLPVWFQKLSVAVMFGIEIGLPILFFFPRRLRMIACFGQILLQVLIMLTGNYNFFNLLTITLCLPLLDDAFFRRIVPTRMAAAAVPRFDRRRTPWIKRAVLWPAAGVILVLNLVWMAHTLRRDRTDRTLRYEYLPVPIQRAVRACLPFDLVNSYGLFRHMTTRRPEIIVEGSEDGRTWHAYEFKWKPGDLRRRPMQVAPHQPRLDWQMWFAAMGSYRSPRNQWFVNFERRLLEGSADVLALLEHNPFPDRPPRYIRAILYEYRFTDWPTRRREGTWWAREYLGPYTPVLSLDSFRRR